MVLSVGNALDGNKKHYVGQAAIVLLLSKLAMTIRIGFVSLEIFEIKYVKCYCLVPQTE